MAEVEKEIGKVVHFYNKIMVAVLSLSGELIVGDKVKFVHAGQEFEQTIESMEVNHQKVQTAKPGDEVAIQTAQKVHENTLIYKVE